MAEAKVQQECPYCHGNADLIHQYRDPLPLLDEPGILEFVTILDDEYYLTTAIPNWGFTNFRLSYCPACGRNLEVEK